MVSSSFVLNGFGQLPEIQKLYPKHFPITSENHVSRALSDTPSGLRQDWAVKIKGFLASQISPSVATNFINQWASLAWNSWIKSRDTLTSSTFKSLVIALPTTFLSAWENDVKDKRRRWNSTYPAYQKLLLHLRSLPDVSLDRPTQLEIARQAAMFGRFAQDVLVFLNQQHGIMQEIANKTKNIDLDLGLEEIGKAGNSIAKKATNIVTKVSEKVVAPIVSGVFSALPWWGWLGIAIAGTIVISPYVGAFRRR